MLPFDELNEDETLSRHHVADEFHGIPRQERPGFEAYEEDDPFRVWKKRGDGYLIAVESPSAEDLNLSS